MKRAKNLHYRAFLIRFWQDSKDGPWRGTLEDPHTGQHHAFARLDDLLDFLKAQTGTAPHSSPHQPQGE